MKIQRLMAIFTALFAILYTNIAHAKPELQADAGNTAWILISSALVMLMTPGLAFFYAGMVSRKNVVSTLLQNYVALAVVGLIWVTFGYSLVFSEGNGFIGGTEFIMLDKMLNRVMVDTNIPYYAFMAFQMMFACITPAIITGSIAERVNFKAWVFLLALWSICVYIPVAHWVWGPQGWIAALGGLDFAGGLVVHITAGIAGLVAAMLYGRRINADERGLPNDVSMIMLGAALLWFGWFGFNAGSALISGTLAAHSFVTTFIGASSAFVAWMSVDWIKHKKPSAVGAAIGLVVGLVVITPAAGYVSVPATIFMCGVSGVICNLTAHYFKQLTHLDDTLDVFACHGLGGILGAIMTGLFASKAINPNIPNEGLFISGDETLFIANTISVIAVCAYTAVITFVLVKVVNIIAPIRVHERAEAVGLDKAVHGEVSKYHDRRAYPRPTTDRRQGKDLPPQDIVERRSVEIIQEMAVRVKQKEEKQSKIFNKVDKSILDKPRIISERRNVEAPSTPLPSGDERRKSATPLFTNNKKRA